MSRKHYHDLMAHVKRTMALSQIAGLLSWDQEVMMPANGASARAEEAAALEAVIHNHRTDQRIGGWLDRIDPLHLTDTEAANVRLTRRSYERSVRVPEELAEELARTTSTAQPIWARARAESNFSVFAPMLEQIIKLKREEAGCLASDDTSPYDALLAGFEPGMSVAILQPLLESLRPRLKALRQKIADSGQPQPGLNGLFCPDRQMDIARKLADVVGYDWQSGRLDLSIHPFSSGTAGDARITTRIDPRKPLGCLYSTLHELGHALYEQGIPGAHLLTPVGHHVSMGVHESQSRMWENQIGRSREFCQWLFPRFLEAFGDCGVEDAETFYQIANQVETGFIRTESDEVHYNLHVLLRFELERELIADELDVADLEAEWNRRFHRDFGIVVPMQRTGYYKMYIGRWDYLVIFQPIHWETSMQLS